MLKPLKVVFGVVLLVLLVGPVFAETVDTAWVRRYNGPANEHDEAAAIAVDDSGNVYVTGRSWRRGLDYYYTTIKYYPNGDTAWVRTYSSRKDAASAIAVDGFGDVYVTGGSSGNGTGLDYATIKYYPDGNTAWVRRYNGPGNGDDQANAIAVDNSGNVYVTGISWGRGTYSDYATIKYYPNGDTAWVRRYDGLGNKSEWASAIAVDNSDNVYVTGHSLGSGTGDDYVTIKYYPNGDTAWVGRYNGPGNGTDWAKAIALDSFGNVYVTGESLGKGTYLDYATIKYYPNGDTAWVRRYNGPGIHDDQARGIAIDDSGNVYVTGSGTGSGTGYDYATIKYLANGDTAWVRRYNGPGNSHDWAKALALDDFGNIYVTGGSNDSSTSCDYATIKYYPTGDTAWVRRYNGPGNGWDEAKGIAVDDSGNVHVAGDSRGSGANDDYAIIKYVKR